MNYTSRFRSYFENFGHYLHYILSSYGLNWKRLVFLRSKILYKQCVKCSAALCFAYKIPTKEVYRKKLKGHRISCQYTLSLFFQLFRWQHAEYFKISANKIWNLLLVCTLKSLKLGQINTRQKFL